LAKKPKVVELSYKVKYGMEKWAIKEIAKKNPYLTIRMVEDIINQILEHVYTLVLKDMTWWIKRFVPKMTGRLRFDFWSYLQQSTVKKTKLTIILRTTQLYGKWVNKMKTSQVRHKGKKVTVDGIEFTLYDPQAIGGFFEKMVDATIKSIEMNLKKIKSKFARKTKLKYKEMKIVGLW